MLASVRGCLYTPSNDYKTIKNHIKSGFPLLNTKFSLTKPIFQEFYNLSVFEGISIGIRGAFHSLKLPKLSISHNLITGCDEIDLSSENITSYTTFDMTGFPLLSLLGEVLFPHFLVDNQWVVDMNDSEFAAVDNAYIVSFDDQNNINGVRKYGPG